MRLRTFLLPMAHKKCPFLAGGLLFFFFLSQTQSSSIVGTSAFLLSSAPTLSSSKHNWEHNPITTQQYTSRVGENFFQRNKKTRLSISSGFTFFDEEQFLVSAQKPIGIVLEEDDTTSYKSVIEVVEGYSAAQAGVQVGDILVAVQNADCLTKPLEETLAFIGDCPRVVNLRFVRPSDSNKSY